MYLEGDTSLAPERVGTFKGGKGKKKQTPSFSSDLDQFFNN
jgi:hypothetical protein